MKFVWTPLTEAILRSIAFGRATLPEIAAACGCPEKTAKNKMGKLGLPLTSRVDEPVRIRINTMPAAAGRRPGSPVKSASQSKSSRSTLPLADAR